MRRVFHLGLCALAVGWVAGCSSTSPRRHPRATRYVPNHERQIPRGKDTVASRPSGNSQPAKGQEDFSSRTLQPGDKVTISLLGIPPQAIIFQAFVDENGALNLPYIGNVTVSGRMKSEAEKLIEKTYIEGEIYKTITVNILPPEVQYFTKGEVRRPGGFPLTRGLTLLQAISNSGGYTEFADPKSIQILREGKTLTFNAPRIERGKEPDPAIQPDDVINVPRGWM